MERLFAEIQDLITRSLQSVQQAIIQDRHSFELYGYDVLIDSDLKPWLIEVNASPSLSGSNKEDYALKHDVLTDLLNVVDIEGYNTGRYLGCLLTAPVFLPQLCSYRAQVPSDFHKPFPHTYHLLTNSFIVGRETNIGGFDLVYDGVPIGEPLESFRNLASSAAKPAPARHGAALLRSKIGCHCSSGSSEHSSG